MKLALEMMLVAVVASLFAITLFRFVIVPYVQWCFPGLMW